MKAAKLSALLAAGYLGGEAAATQYLANRYDCAPQLGRPAFMVGEQCAFQPFAWNNWADKVRLKDREAWNTANMLSLSGLAAGVGSAALLGLMQRQVRTLDAFGTARWADMTELRKQGLMGSHGVVLGQTNDAVFKGGNASEFGNLVKPGTLLFHDGPQHVLMFAPTRSGKGASVVIPTLLTWLGSTVVYDMKGSNYEATAGHRSRYSHCLRFNPTQLDSVGHNPLLGVRAYPYDVRDAQEIGGILVSPDESDNRYNHWKATGASFLVAAILHVLYVGEDKSLRGVLRLLSAPAKSFEETLNIMIETRHFDSGPHPAVAGGAMLMKSREEGERSGILSTAVSFLEIFRDPIVAENTARHDFTIADLTCCDRPTSLYLVVPPNDRLRSKPIMRLLYTTIFNRQMEDLHYVPTSSGQKIRKHALLDLRDEFVSPGAFSGFSNQLATCAEYRIKCLLIVQSISQLEEHYGKSNSIVDNCHTAITYGASSNTSAKVISESLGVQTLSRRQESRSRKSGQLMGGSTSVTDQQYGRPLLFPTEAKTLPFHDALVMMTGVSPARCKKVTWWKHPGLMERGYDKRTRRNRAPTSRAELRAQLPPKTLCHWLIEPGKPGSAGSMTQPAENGAGEGAKEENVFHSPEQLRQEEAAVEESWGHQS